jgi:hypothetical protein
MLPNLNQSHCKDKEKICTVTKTQGSPTQVFRQFIPAVFLDNQRRLFYTFENPESNVTWMHGKLMAWGKYKHSHSPNNQSQQHCYDTRKARTAIPQTSACIVKHSHDRKQYLKNISAMSVIQHCVKCHVPSSHSLATTTKLNA